MHLKETIDEDIDEHFRCKSKDLETALYKAIGKEQNITILYNFMDKKASDFHSAPLELIIDQVEDHINSVLGKHTQRTLILKIEPFVTTCLLSR